MLRWRQYHGAHSCTQAWIALQELHRVEAGPKDFFADVVAPAFTSKHTGATAVPKVGCVPQLQLWVFQPFVVQQAVAYRSTQPERRRVRLLSMVWQMLEHNEFVPGFVSSQVALLAAQEAFYESEEAKSRIDTWRNLVKPGWDLYRFNSHVDSIDSHLEPEIAQAFSALSLFPHARIVRLARLTQITVVALADGTRAYAGAVPDELIDFLPLITARLVRLLDHRRSRIGLVSTQPSCPLRS